MTPSLEGWPTKAKEAPSPHKVRLAPLDTNPVFQSLADLYVVLIYNMKLTGNNLLCIKETHAILLSSGFSSKF